jgi:DNA invertase Pin-like site-specific DNA recombinase
VPALGYVTVPPEASLDGREVESQRAAIEEACGAADIQLRDVVVAREDGLPQLVARLEAGDASCLVVSGLERLTRSVDELAWAIDTFERLQVRLIALDVGLDTATPAGRLALGEPAAGVVSAFGYASVPHGAADAADELERQRQVIERRCAEQEFELVGIEREREPKDGKALERPGLSRLLERLAAGEASCVVVAGLERLSRSVAELGTLIRWMEHNEVRLVVTELDLDTASASGRTTARALSSVGSLESERLSKRTSKGLEAARGPDWAALRTRIAAMRADGMTLQAIADVLNAEGVPTQRGGLKWRPSSVQTAAGYKRRQRGGLPQREDGDSPAR